MITSELSQPILAREPRLLRTGEIVRRDALTHALDGAEAEGNLLQHVGFECGGGATWGQCVAGANRRNRSGYPEASDRHQDADQGARCFQSMSHGWKSRFELGLRSTCGCAFRRDSMSLSLPFCVSTGLQISHKTFTEIRQ